MLQPVSDVVNCAADYAQNLQAFFRAMKNQFYNYYLKKNLHSVYA